MRQIRVKKFWNDLCKRPMCSAKWKLSIIYYLALLLEKISLQHSREEGDIDWSVWFAPIPHVGVCAGVRWYVVAGRTRSFRASVGLSLRR